MKHKFISKAILFLALVLPLNANAGLSEEFDTIFGSMSNVTNPVAYQGQSRGVISGGSAYTRNPMWNGDLFTIKPPRVDAGCGGIDMFTGSFSYINADRMIEAFRAIASNAAGYAFKMALETMCPTCSAVMGEIDKIARNLSSMNFDSCQVATKLVDTALPFPTQPQQSELGKKVSDRFKQWGEYSDDFQAWGSGLLRASPISDATEAQKEKLKDEKMLGNIAWASLTESPTLGGSAVISWASHGDKEMAKIIMSLTGSLVITAEQDSDTDKEAPKVEEWIPILNIKDVLGSTKIERPNLSIYSCPDDDCMEKATEQMAIPTMVDRVSTMFFGESGSIGIVEKFITNQGSLSDEEMAFMEAIPIHGKRIRDLAIVSPGGARYYAKSAIETIAAELVDEFIATAIRSIRKAAHAHSYEMNTSFLKKLAEHEDKILAEIKEYRNQVVYSGALDQIYEGIRNSGEKKKLQMEPPTETKSNK